MNRHGRTMLLLALAGLASTPTPVPAEEIDFSCMSHSVRGKTQLTDRYKEYDVVLRNACPGPVYWTMCIERLDPVSHRIVEVHTPSGYLEADKSARVNLQMKKGPDSMGFRKRFQSFYLSVGYAVNGAAQAPCTAKTCEAARGSLRERMDANLTAWARAQSTLEQTLAAECPETGWGRTEEVETCEAAILEAAQEELEAHAATDAALREELQATGPESCELHAGDLVQE